MKSFNGSSTEKQGWGDRYINGYTTSAQQIEVPQVILDLADVFIESCSHNDSSFTDEFVRAIGIGVDYSDFERRWVDYLINDPVDGIRQYSTDDRSLAIGYIHAEADNVSARQWEAAIDQAKASRDYATRTAALMPKTASIEERNYAYATVEAGRAYVFLALAVLGQDPQLTVEASRATVRASAYASVMENGAVPGAVEDAIWIGVRNGMAKQRHHFLGMLQSDFFPVV
jgi:hypothetical protein